MKEKRGREGFTLIELLVVISIIGLLASLVLVAVNTARARGRDAKRMSDIHQIQTLLEAYYTTNGYYPIASYGQTLPYSWWTESGEPSVGSNSWNAFATKLGVATLPIDPKQVPIDRPMLPNGDGVYAYAYFVCQSSQQYILVWRPEVASVPSPGLTCIDQGYVNYGNGSVTIGSPVKSPTVAY